MEYSIDIGGLRGLEAALARAPAIVREELEAAVTEADVLLAREVREHMPTAQGTLRASVFHEETVSGLVVTGFVGSPLAYAAPVELGTRPHFPPVDALIDWVRIRFGISGDKEARGVAFLVARKIARKGTKPQRPFGLAFQAQEQAVRRIFERAAANIAARAVGGEA